jgi:hypothetical protein
MMGLAFKKMAGDGWRLFDHVAGSKRKDIPGETSI